MPVEGHFFLSGVEYLDLEGIPRTGLDCRTGKLIYAFEHSGITIWDGNLWYHL